MYVLYSAVTIGARHRYNQLVSSERVPNNCELPVRIYNICECLVLIRHKCWGPGLVLTSVIDMLMFL